MLDAKPCPSCHTYAAGRGFHYSWCELPEQKKDAMTDLKIGDRVTRPYPYYSGEYEVKAISAENHVLLRYIPNERHSEPHSEPYWTSDAADRLTKVEPKFEIGKKYKYLHARISAGTVYEVVALNVDGDAVVTWAHAYGQEAGIIKQGNRDKYTEVD